LTASPATPATPGQQPILKSKLFWISLLYFTEGFPLGAFYDIFPVYFRQQGVELSKIGLISLLGLAWTLKFLWAPAIDYFRGHRYWMAAVDCAMGAVMLTFAIQAGFGPWVWLAIGAFTVFSATNDIAIDGYTIELLRREEMGLANGFRIGFYRVGMLAAGGFLIIAGYWGWTAAFVGSAVLFAICAIAVLAAPPEVKRPRPEATGVGPEVRALLKAPLWLLALALLVAGLAWPMLGVFDIAALATIKKSWWFRGVIPVGLILAAAVLIAVAARSETSRNNADLAQGPLFGTLIELLRRPEIVAVFVFILTFKLADASIGFMIKPFWVDAGFSPAQIGLVSVNIGLILSIAGGVVGGWYTDRVGIFKGLWVLGLLQAVSNIGYWFAALVLPLKPTGEIPLAHEAILYAASAAESFTGGLGTAAFLAFLMAIVDKRRAATQYAVLSSIFAFSRSVAGWAGGLGAEAMGFANYFLLTFFLAFPAYLLLGPVRRMLLASEAAGETSPVAEASEK
jgi:MFS transporter, PAT family, beta-lactamase induction signal transducer AmpG